MEHSKPTADRQIVITLTESNYRLLQQALCAAQIHHECSESARQRFANLGYEIHCQVEDRLQKRKAKSQE